jgi:integrase
VNRQPGDAADSSASRKPNGRSSIYEGRDGKWHGWVTMGTKPDGRPDRRHREGATETEVTKKVQKLEAERDANKTSKPGRPPKIAQWMRTYITDIAPQRVSQLTIDKTYRPKTENWIIPKLGHHRIDQLYPDHLYKFYAALRKEGLAPNTIVQIHRILSRALKIAVREGKLGVNPCTLIDAPQPVETDSETLTAAEARALLRLTAGRRNGTRWSVGLALGLRQQEALGLRRQFVDLDKAVLFVDWQLKHDRYKHGCDDPHSCGEKWHRYPCSAKCPKAQRTSGRKHICRRPCPPGCTQHGGKCPQFCAADCKRHAKACPQRKGGWRFTRPKGGRRRPVPIPRQLVPMLRKHFEDQAAERAAAGAAWEDWDLVWCQPNGRPADPHVDWEEWKALLKEAGITKDARLHDARHTCGTLLGELHVDMHVIQRILGHAQISTTRIYTDPTDPLTRDAADRMGRALWPEEQPPPGLSAGEARHASALTEALASGDPDRIRKALRAVRESADEAEPQLKVQLSDDTAPYGSGETAG